MVQVIPPVGRAVSGCLTGAGDAYVAGFAYGWSHGHPPEIAGRMGALMAAYAIESVGCQMHCLTESDFLHRYDEEFGGIP